MNGLWIHRWCGHLDIRMGDAEHKIYGSDPGCPSCMRINGKYLDVEISAPGVNKRWKWYNK